MKNIRNKKEELVKALISKNKERIRKVLALNKPEKWMTFQFSNGTIDYLGKKITKDELWALIQEAEINYNVNIVTIDSERMNGAFITETFHFLTDKEALKVTLDLNK